MDDKLKDLLQRALEVTKPLADAAAAGEGKYLVTLLGMYRVSFTTLRDIYYLSQNEGTGPNMLDLTRKIIEHGISIEYMLLKGKEKMAERFQKYLAVQTHEEIELLKAIGIDPASMSNELKIGVEETEKEYEALSMGTKEDKNWAGRNFEGMLEDLVKSDSIKGPDAPRLFSAYVWGCRLNHPNPLVVHGYLDPKESQAAEIFYARLSTVVALAGHLCLATRLIDESREVTGSNIYEEVAVQIHKIQGEIDSLGGVSK